MTQEIDVVKWPCRGYPYELEEASVGQNVAVFSMEKPFIHGTVVESNGNKIKVEPTKQYDGPMRFFT